MLPVSSEKEGSSRLQVTQPKTHVSGPGALLVDVVAVDGSRGGLDAETDILVPTPLAGGLAKGLGVEEDGLLLVRLPARVRGGGKTAWLVGLRARGR